MSQFFYLGFLFTNHCIKSYAETDDKNVDLKEKLRAIDEPKLRTKKLCLGTASGVR